MSESIIYSAYPNPEQDFINGKSSTTALVDLSDMNKALKAVIDINKEKLNVQETVMRCDALPMIASDQIKLEHLFSIIFHVILDNPPSTRSLFIHIRCQPEQRKFNDSLPRDFVLYSIGVHTNNICSSNWKQQYSQQLKECALICEELGGAFEGQYQMDNGCLCNFKIPGKLI